MKNNNRKVAQKYQWPYLWIRIYIFTLDEEQDKINTVMEDRKLSEKESLDIFLYRNRGCIRCAGRMSK